jgi:four helix bundle protein
MNKIRMTNNEIRNKLARRMADELNTPDWDDERHEEEFWGVAPGTGADQLQDGDAGARRVFDLEERTARFGETIIRFAKKIPFNPVNNRLIDQLVGAGTSVGANYCEANDGVSRKDFKHKIGICRKEAKETRFFLRMIATAEPGLKTDARVLWQEARELNLIFSSIWRK